MKIKRKLDMDRYETMLRDLEKMHEKNEVSEQTYQEMKAKYEEKLKELEDSYFEGGEEAMETDELGMRIGEQVEAAVSTAMGKIEKLMSEVPDFDGMGSYLKKEDVYEGSFDTDSVQIDFSTVNGYIELKKWDNDTYKVVVTKKVRSYSPERAKRKLDRTEVEFKHRKNGRESLELEAHGDNVTVDITAYLPDKARLAEGHIIYDLDLESENGHLTVSGIYTQKVRVETENGRIGFEGVHTRELEAQTENGRILLENVEGETFSVSTENGRIELLDVQGEGLEASAENGSLRGKVSFKNGELETEHGSISISPRGGGNYQARTETGSVKIELDRTVPFLVEAATEMGSIRVPPDLEVSYKGRHHATVKSKEFDGAEERLSIEAETDMGSIIIQ